MLIRLSIRFSGLIFASGPGRGAIPRFASGTDPSRGAAPGAVTLHDGTQDRLRDARGPIPGEVEQLRVRLLPVQDDGPVHAVQMQNHVGDVLELRGGGALWRHESHEDAPGTADPGE